MSEEAKLMHDEFLKDEGYSGTYIERLANNVKDLRADVEDLKITINRRVKLVEALIDSQIAHARVADKQIADAKNIAELEAKLKYDRQFPTIPPVTTVQVDERGKLIQTEVTW